MKNESSVGVIIPLSWDNNKWEQGETFNHNQSKSLIRDYLFTQEKITFGNHKYPLEDDGTYIGYSRMITKMLKRDDEFYWNDYEIIFFVSSFKIRYIIGLYLHPQVDWSFGRKRKHEVFNSFTFTNIKARSENIVRFENFVPIRSDGRFVSIFKNLKTTDYAYLGKSDIHEILDEAIHRNPNQNELKTILTKI